VLGDHVTLADVLIVPQIFNAQRYDCRLDHVPTIMRIFDACMRLPAFGDARPEKQPDFA
jgi:glutathione S-transferase